MYIIGGATASGKSAYAIDLANQVGGVIINADSIQLYRPFHVLTSKPSLEEFKAAPHKLYGIFKNTLPPKTVLEWLSEVKREIEEAHNANLIPIIVGGTGFYLKVLLEGLSPIPPIPLEIKESIRALADSMTFLELYKFTQNTDPIGVAQLSVSDHRRLIRILEVNQTTGHSITWFHNNKTGGYKNKLLKNGFILLMPDLNHMTQRIQDRVYYMMENGAISEVENFLSEKPDPKSPCFYTIGVREIQKYLLGELSKEETINQIYLRTRRYAKRQRTFFNGQFREFIPTIINPDLS